jgi:hypothetical protein
MGQYYTAVLKSGNGRLKGYEILGSLKLTEHSYFNNYLVNAICNKLLERPYKVGWVGDYADKEDLNYDKKMVDFMEANINIINVSDKPYKFDHTNKVLLNHTKKQKIHLGKYYEENKELWWENYWCIHPLPLLTAMGNGKGGGDYFGENQDAVGTWANDLLEIVVEQEDKFEYQELNINFKETR